MKRFHCSQAVLAAGLSKAGIKNEGAVKALGLFGGGISGSGRVCGVLSGSIALISTLFSRGSLDGKEDPRMWRLGHEAIARFEELSKEFGGTDCRDIAGIDWRDPKAAKDFYANPESSRRRCVQLVGDMAFILGELLDRELQ
jgi:C_GCAxxG_C_C family probable redox protein